MELFGAMLGLSAVSLIVLAVVLSVLLPIFWLWMLADAIIREASAFPSQDNVEKIVWIVLMVAVQPVAILYFFLVWRTQERVRLRAGRGDQAVPSAV